MLFWRILERDHFLTFRHNLQYSGGMNCCRSWRKRVVVFSVSFKTEKKCSKNREPLLPVKKKAYKFSIDSFFEKSFEVATFTWFLFFSVQTNFVFGAQKWDDWLSWRLWESLWKKCKRHLKSYRHCCQMALPIWIPPWPTERVNT